MDKQTNESKHAAREKAFEAYMQCEHDIEKPNYTGPISVCDVCRGRFSEESFYAGYDAGIARTWTKVEDGLPEEGVRLPVTVLERDGTYAVEIAHHENGIWFDDCGGLMIGKAIAWMPLPPAFEVESKTEARLREIRAVKHGSSEDVLVGGGK